VLKFDLEIQAFEITAQTGRNTWLWAANKFDVTGQVTDHAKKRCCCQSIHGRQPAFRSSSLTDAIVEKITGRKGIARTKVAFKSTTGQNSEIYVSDYDVTMPSRLPRTTISRDPAWFPAAAALLHLVPAGNPDGSIRTDCKSGTTRAFARYPGLTPAPLCPGRRRLALILSKGGSPDIYVCDSDNSN